MLYIANKQEMVMMTKEDIQNSGDLWWSGRELSRLDVTGAFIFLTAIELNKLFLFLKFSNLYIVTVNRNSAKMKQLDSSILRQFKNMAS